MLQELRPRPHLERSSRASERGTRADNVLRTHSHPVDDPRLGALEPIGNTLCPFLCPLLLRCSRFVRVLRDCDIDPKANG